MSRAFSITMIAVLAAWMFVFHLVIKKPPDPRYVSAMAEMRKAETTWVGAYPPDFELHRIDGGSFRLSNEVGSKLLVLNFFATWCAPCRAEIPELERYAALHTDELMLVGIDVKEDLKDATRFATRRGITYPVALDPDGRVAALYEVESFPSTVVVGLDGRVLLYERGMINNADIAFDSLVRRQRDGAEGAARISPEEFRLAVAAAGHPSGKTPAAAAEPVLSPRAAELALRIRCPSCGRNLLACNSRVSLELRSRLAKLDVDHMSDDEVLEALFLLPGDSP